MKNTFATIALVLGSLFSVSMASAEEVERSRVSHLRTREESEGMLRRLHVRVSMCEPMKIIGKPKTKISGKTLHVRLPLHLFGSFNKANKIAGSSDFSITIPDGVERITLGKRNCEIWPRDVCAKTLEPDEAKARDIALKQFNKDCPTTDPFDIIVVVYRYSSGHTILKSSEPGFEVIVNQAQGRVIYKIINFEIAEVFRQAIGPCGTY